MANINIEFEYNLPDEYLHQTATKGLKAKWTYVGPEKIWITVDNQSGQLEWSSGWHADDGTEETRDFMITKAGLARKAILLDARQEPLIAAIFTDRILSDQLPQKEYKLADGTVYYSRPEPTQPDHTYEVADIKYNLATDTWVKPFPWKKPHITMEQLNAVRLSIIDAVSNDIADSATAADLKIKLAAFKAELEAVPTKYAGADAWMIPFPDDPRREEGPLPESTPPQ